MTVIVHVFEIEVMFVSFAVIVAVCPAVAVDLTVTKPVLETVATLVLLLVHVISLFWLALDGT